MAYFEFPISESMANERFHTLFECAPRGAESSLEQIHMDIAASVQKVVEEAVEGIAKYAQDLTQSRNLCLAGGVASNCVANGRLSRKKIFDNIWVQPASGDAGGAVGAAFSVWGDMLNNPKDVSDLKRDSMSGSFLGPEYEHDFIRNYL